MRRREVLAVGGLSSVGLIAGCLGVFDDCPDPEIEEELSIEPNRLEGQEIFDFPIDTEIELATSADELDAFEALPEDERAWGRETDFDQSVVIGVQSSAPSDYPFPQILGVDRERTESVRVYKCFDGEGDNVDEAPFSYLLRVEHEGDVPEVADLSLWRNDEWRTYSSQ